MFSATLPGKGNMTKKYNCIKNNGNSYYRIKRTLPNGKCKDFYGKSKAEAIKKYEKYKQEHTAPNLEYSEMEFGKLFEIWLYQIKRLDSIKPATFARYDASYRNHIRGCRLSRIPIYKLKSIDLQLFINDMVDQGLTPANIKNIFKLVKIFIHYLYDEDALTKDISHNVKIPRALDVQNRIRVFTPYEKSLISSQLDTCPYAFLIQLGFASGMRLGEMLALQYNDFTSTGVSINKTLSCVYVVTDANTRIRQKLIIPPKTPNSVRFIPLPDQTLEALKTHKKKHDIILREHHADCHGYCFTMSNGEIHDLTSVNKSIKKFFSRCGVENHSVHDLRHTYISSLVEAGVELATVKELAGHSDISMTLKYTHIHEDMKRRAVINSASYLCL
jgi:site-specific recombinase XerD